jgi:hypothetical protein
VKGPKRVKKDDRSLPENDVALGTGELDMPAILKEAKKVGINIVHRDESSSILTMCHRHYI